MVTRNVLLKENSVITQCIKCGNNTKFRCIAEQIAEDLCETWVECLDCGFDPTRENTDYRFENVWGSVDQAHTNVAFDCWNEAIAELFEDSETP